jgi:3-phenylpropionate/trans-cinnamate dioxygenase ferredoxin reductase component
VTAFVIGDEPQRPYERPLLSKDYLAVRQEIATAFADLHWANDVHLRLGRHSRSSTGPNALNQPAVAAATMLGEDAAYDEQPYFYTDQFDLGMEYLGHVEPDGYDRLVIRGDAAAREFTAFWLRDGRVLAGMNVNVWDLTEPIQGSHPLRRGRRRATVGRPAVPLEDLA